MNFWDYLAQANGYGKGKMERKRQAKWDAANLRTVSTKVSVAEAERLHAACAAAGVSLYDLLRRLCREWLADIERRETPSAAERVMV